MNIDIITLFPEMFENFLQTSIMGRAISNKHISISLHDLRQYAINKHGQVDDYAYGGGAGMVMRVEPIDDCLKDLEQKISPARFDEVIYLSPDGELLTQDLCNYFSLQKNIALVCGHYKGVDQRVRDHLVTREVSVGEYVLSGGELPAMILCDAIGRLIPNVLNDETSALTDSHQDGMIAPPVYTRPREYKGWSVPDVLCSGDQAKIEGWRHQESVRRTELYNIKNK